MDDVIQEIKLDNKKDFKVIRKLLVIIRKKNTNSYASLDYSFNIRV